MSLVVRNGLRLLPSTLAGLDARLRGLRSDVAALVSRKRAAFVAETAVRLADRRLAAPGATDEDAGLAPVHAARRRLARADAYCHGGGIQSRSHADAYPDHRLELVAFPKGRRIYAMSFAEDRDLADLLRSGDWVRDFSYWDDADGPDDVADPEWRARERVWREILKGCDGRVPANGGYSVVLSPRRYDMPDLAAVRAALPPLETRIRGLALDAVHARWSRETYLRIESEGREPSIGEYVMGFGKARREDPRWDAAIAEEKERLAALLPAEPTAGYLDGGSEED